ncbi:MAG TPA: hypothetical protein VGK94_08665 [Candidatus Polarisedimenticolia bacterium]|jgi:hypothetical protein
MRSGERSSALDFERDLPTTTQDVLALRRVKELAPLDLDGYLRFLAQLPAPTAQTLRSKRGSEAAPPFELAR